MPEPPRNAFQYAIVRVVPRVERGECLNVGVVLLCRPRRYLGARMALDEARLRAFAPALDPATIRRERLGRPAQQRRAHPRAADGDDADPLVRPVPEFCPHLDAIERIAVGDPGAGPIGRLEQAERFHWLVAPSSTIIQPSEVHSGLCDDPAAELDHLVATLVAT